METSFFFFQLRWRKSLIHTFENGWNNQSTWHYPFFYLKQWHMSLLCTNNTNEILMTLKVYIVWLILKLLLIGRWEFNWIKCENTLTSVNNDANWFSYIKKVITYC